MNEIELALIAIFYGLRVSALALQSQGFVIDVRRNGNVRIRYVVNTTRTGTDVVPVYRLNVRERPFPVLKGSFGGGQGVALFSALRRATFLSRIREDGKADAANNENARTEANQ